MNQVASVLRIQKQTVFFSSAEKMEEIPTEAIDVIITSPPYNRKKHYQSDDLTEHNDQLPESAYLEFLQTVWRECYRVCAPHGVFFLNIGDAAQSQGLSEKVVQSAVAEGWTRIQDIVWVKSIYGKGHYTPTGSNKRFHNLWEHIFLLVKDPGVYALCPQAIGIPYADKSNIGRYGATDLRDPGNVWHIWYDKTTGETIKKGHDAPFPIGVPYQCLKAVPRARTVLDPFLGTGTTLAAAQKLDLEGYGYELYPRKDLIQQTIRDGIRYEPPEVVLLPHYETTIRVLVDLLDTTQITVPPSTTKKMATDYQIARDTLQKCQFGEKTARKLARFFASSGRSSGLLDSFLHPK